MDWREIAGQPTFSLPASTPSSAGWMDMFGGAWSGGKLVGVGAAGSAGGLYDESDGSNEFVRDWVHEWDGQADSKRGWVIAGAWGIASCVDVLFLHHFVRRPTHILDHAASFTFNHILLTIYYSAHFPSSIFFWIVMTTCTVGTIVWAEQVCVAREMREGIGDWSGNLDVEQQQAFMGDRNHRNEGDEELEMIGIGEDRR
ncbi:Integral membrane protein SYS1-related [Phaffia rhodozyma]|uniref:Integral membrane protein SYS1-related n=1 Tax=Phaffia rhodozyma TaxID=264483 RepID=A0A0F7SFY7_PHARH|nr:Integral membrane protein SYS1-related [Phaffia rhodozyma]